MYEKFSVASHDGLEFDSYLFSPSKRPAPGVVMIPEVFGINAPLREIARRFADAGYAVLVPDIFWRLERNVELGYNEDSYKKAFALHKAFDYESGVQDMDAAVASLREHTGYDGNVAAIGFCLGGTMAYLAGARCHIQFPVSYCGTRIQNFVDDASKVRCPTILNFDEIDHTTPPEFMDRTLPAVEPNSNIKFHIYSGAGHAFTNPGRSDTYVHEASELVHARTFELFGKFMPYGNQE